MSIKIQHIDNGNFGIINRLLIIYFTRYSFVHYRYPAGNNPAGIKHPPIAMLHWGLLTFNPSGCRLPVLTINH